MLKSKKWRSGLIAGTAALMAAGVTGAVIAAEATDNNTNGGTKKTGNASGKWWHLWVKNGYAKLNVNRDGVMNADWNLKSPGGNTVLGIGWTGRGANRGAVNYNLGQFTAGSASGKRNSWVSYHGWGKDRNGAIVEYYITDRWGEWKPRCGGKDAKKGDDYTIRGEGTYSLYICWKKGPNAYNGDVNQSFKQHYAVRTKRRDIGKDHRISFGKHLDKWRAKNRNYDVTSVLWQIMACEGYQSDGKCSMSAWR